MEYKLNKSGHLINVFKHLDPVLSNYNKPGSGNLHNLGIKEKCLIVSAIEEDYAELKNRIYLNPHVQSWVGQIHKITISNQLATSMQYSAIARHLLRAKWAVVRLHAEALWVDYILHYAKLEYAQPWRDLASRMKNRTVGQCFNDAGHSTTASKECLKIYGEPLTC